MSKPSVINTSSGYVTLPRLFKVGTKWNEKVQLTNSKVNAMIFPTTESAEHYVFVNNINGTIENADSPCIHYLSVSEDEADSCPIYTKPHLKKVYIISGNLGYISEDGDWISTDYGFVNMYDMACVLGQDVISKARQCGGFDDYSPYNGTTEFYFANKREANRFLKYLQVKLLERNYAFSED